MSGSVRAAPFRIEKPPDFRKRELLTCKALRKYLERSREGFPKESEPRLRGEERDELIVGRARLCPLQTLPGNDKSKLVEADLRVPEWWNW